MMELISLLVKLFHINHRRLESRGENFYIALDTV